MVAWEKFLVNAAANTIIGYSNYFFPLIWCNYSLISSFCYGARKIYFIYN